jgi:hypothetical protein
MTLVSRMDLYQEQEHLKKVLGDSSSPLISAIARLLVFDGSSWMNSKKAGLLVLVVDRVRECKILRLYDMRSWEVIFDEELYVGMKYVASTGYFHQFEAQGGIYGFDFANEKQAEMLWAKVNQCIPRDAMTASMKSNSGGLVISKPKNVIHQRHIGYDPEHGFQVKDIPAEWKMFFIEAGLKPKDLKNPIIAQQVASTVEQMQEQGIVLPPQTKVVQAPAAPIAPAAPAVPIAPRAPVAPKAPAVPVAPPAPAVAAIAPPKSQGFTANDLSKVALNPVGSRAAAPASVKEWTDVLAERIGKMREVIEDDNFAADDDDEEWKN